MGRFIRDIRASISMEMTGIFTLFVLIIILSYDVGSAMIRQFRIEKLSYSLASIIRERQEFYKNKEEVMQEEVENLYEIARHLISDIKEELPLGLVVESLIFQGGDILTQGDVSTSTFVQGDIECELDESIDAFKDLAFYTNFGKWTNLYRVTVCTERKNKFTRVDSIKVLKPVVSSIVYGR